MSVDEPVQHDAAASLAEALTRTPGVAAMHAGDFGEIALLYPGERIRGLRVTDGRLEAHISVDLQALSPATDLRSFADTVRTVAAEHTSLPVDVYIDDAV